MVKGIISGPTIMVKGIISGPTSSSSVNPAIQVHVFQAVITDGRKLHNTATG